MVNTDFVKKILKNKSWSRRLQYEWLGAIADSFQPRGKVLDLGGVSKAEYHSLLKLKPEQVIVWNFDEKSKPDALVDLEKVKNLPPFPSDCTAVLAMNLLEHLYRPLDLLEWVVKGLPPQGKLVILVPFLYPIHPSPNDFWRLTPQTFERFFDEMKKEGVSGKLSVVPLYKDFREGLAPLTSGLFKGSISERMLATMLEGSAYIASGVTRLFGGTNSLKTWAAHNPSAIGIMWEKR